MRHFSSSEVASSEEWKLLEEIEAYLFLTAFPFLRARIKGKLTTEKVVELLRELTQVKIRWPVYYENRDTEIQAMEDVGEPIRRCAADLLRQWGEEA